MSDRTDFFSSDTDPVPAASISRGDFFSTGDISGVKDPTEPPAEEVTPTSVVAAKLLEGAAALPSMVVGGYRGLWDIVRGKGAQQATQDIQNTHLIKPHYERINTPGAALAQEAMDYPTNPAAWPADFQKLSESPNTQRGMEFMGIDPLVANPTAQGVMSAGPFLGGLGARGAAAERAVPPGTPPAMPAIQDAQAYMDKQAASQSMGAAGAAPQLASLNPIIQRRIIAKRQAQEPVNFGAVEAHQKAQSLDVPIDLTEGEALYNEGGGQWAEEFANKQNVIGKDKNGNDITSPVAARKAENIVALHENIDAQRQMNAPDVVNLDNAEGHTALGQHQVDNYKRAIMTDKQGVDSAYQTMRDAYNKSGQPEFPIDTKAWVANARTQLKNQFAAGQLHGDIASILDEFKDGAPIDFQRAEHLRTRLGEISAEGGTEAKQARIVRSEFEKLPTPAGYGDIQGLANNARQAASRYWTKREMDPAYDAVASELEGPIQKQIRLGQNSPLADKFLSRYVTGAPVADVQTMLANLKDQPTGSQVVKLAHLDQLKKAAGLNIGETPIDSARSFNAKQFENAYQNQRGRAKLIYDDHTNAQLELLKDTGHRVAVPPAGITAATSGTAQALMRSATSQGASMIAGHIANVGTKGLYKPARSMINAWRDSARQQQWIQRTLEPGAGI